MFFLSLFFIYLFFCFVSTSFSGWIQDKGMTVRSSYQKITLISFECMLYMCISMHGCMCVDVCLYPCKRFLCQTIRTRHFWVDEKGYEISTHFRNELFRITSLFVDHHFIRTSYIGLGSYTIFFFIFKNYNLK